MRQESTHIEPIKALTRGSLVVEALDRMEEHKVSELPLIDDQGMYLGLLTEDALLDAIDENASVTQAYNPAHAPFVRSSAHAFEILALTTQFRLTLIPVIDEDGRYISAYLLSDVVEFFRDTPTLMQPGAVAVLSVEQAQYSMVTVSTVVEQNDAKVLGLWMVEPVAAGMIRFILKLNTEHSGPIIQSIQRYGYTLDGLHGDLSFEQDYQNRYDHLMNYLKY
ncbi:MAG: Uncharacterised protein [Cryomorphaceae bacterium]|nr:MAG: Uncharacterised protein [Cryomorphaceae bacterium]